MRNIGERAINSSKNSSILELDVSYLYWLQFKLSASVLVTDSVYTRRMDFTTKKQIFLKKGDLIEITPKSLIAVGSGQVWVTFAGVENDYVLKTGDRLNCDAPKPVIEALEPSYIVIYEQPSRYSLFNLLGAWSEQSLR